MNEKNLETFDNTLSGDWSDFVKFCETPIIEDECGESKKGGR